jgi:hypothetical protein
LVLEAVVANPEVFSVEVDVFALDGEVVGRLSAQMAFFADAISQPAVLALQADAIPQVVEATLAAFCGPSFDRGIGLRCVGGGVVHKP